MRKRSHRKESRIQLLISVISVTLVLVLLGVIVLFVMTAKEISRQVREDLTVTIVMQDEVTEENAHALEEELAQRRYVNEITYISAEDALEEQSELLGMDPSEFLGANPFSISMEVKMKASYACTDSLQWIAAQLKNDPLVSEVFYQQDLVEDLNRNLNRVSMFLLVVALLLVLISVGLINNTVRLSIQNHRFVIHTMQLVGSQWSLIRRPFMVRSFWVGLISACIAIGVLMGGIHWAYRYDEKVILYITPFIRFVIVMTILGVGLLISMLCTYLSVNHILTKRENDLY